MNKAKPENQTTYFKEHPPKCLLDFASQSDWLDNTDYDGHGFSGVYPNGLVTKLNIVFAVNCKCGNSLHSIVAESEQEEIWRYKDLVIAEKYFLECSSCRSRQLLFDPTLHGYNAVTSQMEGWSLSENVEGDSPSRKGEKLICECPSCHNTEFEVFARFEYSADLFDAPSFEGKEQDLFSWFTGIGRCKACSTTSQFIDYECA